MKLDITPERSMGSLQTEFSEAFPGLKLAFFSKPHREFKGSAAKFLLQDREATLSQLSTKLQAGELTLEPSTVVTDLEQAFEQKFGLHVQVFRKSGNIWLETSVTDNLTLAEQQAKAANSENIHQEFVDPLDYREQD
jgi:hypothetical protein